MSTLEDAVALGLAADEFLLNPLKSFCASEIKRLVAVETVWKTLNSVIRIPDLPDACSEVLSLKTNECLDHESFLEASEESLIFLLEMETLSIDSELDLIKACVKLANTKSEEEEVVLMKAVIPHLRLLNLPMVQLDQLCKYLSDSQISFLAKRLICKDKVVDLPPTVNLSTLSRIRKQPNFQKFVVEFIAEDLIKNCFEMIGLELKKNATAMKTMRIRLVAQQHLFLKGLEVLTKANNWPGFEVLNDNNTTSLRFSTLKAKYEEDLVVKVRVGLKGEELKDIFELKITDEKEYNSWSYIDFKDKVFVPKGAICLVDIFSKNSYQLIPYPHIRKNINQAAKQAAFSQFDILFFEKAEENNKYILKSLEQDGEYFTSIKSLSVAPLSEEGYFE